MQLFVVSTKRHANNHTDVHYKQINNRSRILTWSKGHKESGHRHEFPFLLSCTNRQKNKNVSITEFIVLVLFNKLTEQLHAAVK